MIGLVGDVSDRDENKRLGYLAGQKRRNLAENRILLWIESEGTVARTKISDRL